MATYTSVYTLSTTSTRSYISQSYARHAPIVERSDVREFQTV